METVRVALGADGVYTALERVQMLTGVPLVSGRGLRPMSRCISLLGAFLTLWRNGDPDSLLNQYHPLAFYSDSLVPYGT